MSASERTRVLSTREGYDRWAASYDHDGNPLLALEEPRVDELLGDVTDLAVADVGCGTGRHALRLARRGARVTAIDFSEGMLERARAKPGSDGVRFVVHDATAPLPFASGTFDRVLNALVLEHVRDLPPFFAELGRVCKPDGSIVLSAMHPAMMLRGVTARFVDDAGEEIRPQSYPNQISDYVMASLAAGLRLLHISEHPVDADLAAQLPRAARYVGFPMLLTMKLAPTASR
jgi:ubiquinone/menaquinone biosynthesis C-methylase UbiE